MDYFLLYDQYRGLYINAWSTLFICRSQTFLCWAKHTSNIENKMHSFIDIKSVYN